MTGRPNLRLVEQSPWSNPRAYAPDPIESLRQTLAERRERRIDYAFIAAGAAVAGAALYVAWLAGAV